MRVLSVAYGVAVYCLFLGTFLYAAAFVENLPVPKSIDSGVPGVLPQALIVDVLLLGVFAAQHSIMARRGFKRWWTRIVPRPVERSTFVLFSSLALLLLYWQWQPIPQPVWTVLDPAASTVLGVLCWAGWALVVGSTVLINHFELFGVAQVLAYADGRELTPPQFRTPSVYRYVRHPLYLGFVVAFWATPSMSVGHLIFAVATTGYILLGIFFEERDLIAQFGERYRRYRAEVGMLLPKLRRAATAGESARPVSDAGTPGASFRSGAGTGG